MGLKKIWQKHCTPEEARFLLMACFGRSPFFSAEIQLYTDGSFFSALKRMTSLPAFRHTVLDPLVLVRPPLYLPLDEQTRALAVKILKRQFNVPEKLLKAPPRTWAALMTILLGVPRFQKACLSSFTEGTLRFLKSKYAAHDSERQSIWGTVHQLGPQLIGGQLFCADHMRPPDTATLHLDLYFDGAFAQTITLPSDRWHSGIMTFEHKLDAATLPAPLPEEAPLHLFAGDDGPMIAPPFDVCLKPTAAADLLRRTRLLLDELASNTSPHAEHAAMLGRLKGRLPTLEQYASPHLDDYALYAAMYRPGPVITQDQKEPVSILLLAEGDTKERLALEATLPAQLALKVHVASGKELAYATIDVAAYDLIVPIPHASVPAAELADWLADFAVRQPDVPLIRFGHDEQRKDGSRCNPIFPCRFDPFHLRTDPAYPYAYAVQGSFLAHIMGQTPSIKLFGRDASALFEAAFEKNEGRIKRDYIPHVLLSKPAAHASSNAPQRLYQPSGGEQNDTAVISVIIPTKDRLDLIKPCLESLRATAKKADQLDIIIIDNGSSDETLAHWLDDMQAQGLCRVIRDEQAFNWSALNNHGAALARGDILLFLNDDTVAVSQSWDDALRRYLSDPMTGIVGAKLLYPSGRIQHGGVLLTDNLMVIHEGKGYEGEDPGYAGRLAATRSVDAVTGAFLAIRQDEFTACGGFDTSFAVTYNDIDLCSSVSARGLMCVYAPDIIFTHYESESRGIDELNPDTLARKQAEHAAFQEKWQSFYQAQRTTAGYPYPEVFDMETARAFTRLKLPTPQNNT